MTGERISNIATMPFFGKKDDKYYQRDMQRRIGISSAIVNENTRYLKCKIAFNCKRKEWKQACDTCLFNENSPIPKMQRTNNYKPIVDTGRPLTIDGRIREKMNDPIFL